MDLLVAKFWFPEEPTDPLIFRSFNQLPADERKASLWRFQARPALQNVPHLLSVPNTDDALALMVASTM